MQYIPNPWAQSLDVLSQALMQQKKSKQTLENQQELQYQKIKQEEQERERKKSYQKQQNTLLADVLSKEEVNLDSPEGMQNLLRAWAMSDGDPDILSKYLSSYNTGVGASVKAKEKKAAPQTANEKVTYTKNQAYSNSIVNSLPALYNLYGMLDEAEEAIQSGKYAQSPAAYKYRANAPQMLGGGLTAEDATLNKVQKEFVSLTNNFKGVLTNAKLKMLADANIDPKKSMEANLQAIKLMREGLEETLMVPQAIDELTSEDPGAWSDPRFQFRVMEKLGYTGALNEGKQQVFDTLPSAKEYKGKTLRDPDTGVRYKSNGKRWQKVK